MLVAIGVFAASLIIMSAVTLPGLMPQRSVAGDHTGHDSHGTDPHGVNGNAGTTAAPQVKSSPVSVAMSALLVVVLSIIVAAGFIQLSNM